MDKAYKEFFKAAKEAKQPSSKRKKKPTSKKSSTPTPIKRKKKAPSLPLGSLIFAGLGLIVATYGLLNIDRVEKYIDNIEVSFLGQGVAAESNQAKKTEPKGEEKAKAAAQANREKASEKNSENNWTSENLNHFGKLNERKKDLDMREAELDELEKELHKQKSEVEARIRKLEELRMQIAQVLKEKVDVDEGRVKKLVDFYSNMKPLNAAQIISSLNEDLAVEILGRMKKKNAADILNLLKPNKAQVLSEKFAGYKRR